MHHPMTGAIETTAVSQTEMPEAPVTAPFLRVPWLGNGLYPCLADAPSRALYAGVSPNPR